MAILKNKLFLFVKHFTYPSLDVQGRYPELTLEQGEETTNLEM